MGYIKGDTRSLDYNSLGLLIWYFAKLARLLSEAVAEFRVSSNDLARCSWAILSRFPECDLCAGGAYC